MTEKKWTLIIEGRRDGFYAVLRESGKMNTALKISEEQVPWFNMLRNLLKENDDDPLTWRSSEG